MKASTYGQEVGKYWLSIVCFWKPRLVVVTDSSVLLFKSGFANSTKVGELISRSPLTSQPLRRDGRGLVVGEHKIFPPPGASRETDATMSAALAAGQPLAAAPQPGPPAPAGASVPPSGASVPPPGASVPPPA